MLREYGHDTNLSRLSFLRATDDKIRVDRLIIRSPVAVFEGNEMRTRHVKAGNQQS